MPRSGPSAADRELIAQLANRDLTISPAQLERWRSARLLPGNHRRGRGRGQGSVSAPAPGAVEAAAALAAHARQGRDLRLAVVDWFAEAGRTMPGDPAVPEPPDALVHAAVQWVIASNRAYQLFQLARSAHTEPQVDAFYEAAGKAISRASVASAIDPAAMRNALLTGQDPGEETARPGTIRSALIQLIAAMGLGFDQVPADLFAQAAADSGLYPTAAADAWERTLARFQDPPPAARPVADLLFRRYDPLAMVQLANAELLRRARDAAHGLSGFGAIYLMHGLLMPDTPGLAALRARIDELGLAQILIGMSRGLFSTRGFVDILVACLHPTYQAVHGYLSSQVANGPPLFHGPGGEHTAEKLMADWITAIQRLTPPAGGPDR